MNIERAIRSAFEYYNLKNYQQSEHLCKKILKRQPKNFDILHLLGFIRNLSNDYDSAIMYLKKAIAINPSHADAQNNLGIALYNKGQIDDAIPCFKKALEINSYHSDAYSNLGSAFFEKGNLDEAKEQYQKALYCNPNHAVAHNNLGKALMDMGQIQEALPCFQKAIKLNPLNALAHFHLSLVLLLSADFKRGWKEYEWRWGLEENPPPNFQQPKWDGSDLRGKTILLHTEQGIGDAIHFIRYAALVAQRGAKVIVECQKELASLMRSVEDVHEVINRGEKLPLFDVHCPLLSLPFVFDTNIESIPAKVPYISVDSLLIQKWREKVQSNTATTKVGLVWAGGPGHKKNRFRSCDLEAFAPLSTMQGVTLYSLQKGEAEEQAKKPPEGMQLINFMDEISNFEDTAALIENLDLIISVDTAVAHLSGALGKPVWTLLSFSPDWRWMLNRKDSPWYPSMRLFRQTAFGDWIPVLAQVAEELRLLTAIR